MRAAILRNIPITRKLLWYLTGKRIVTFTFFSGYRKERDPKYEIRVQFPNSVTDIQMNYVGDGGPSKRVDLTPISKCKKLQSLCIERNDMPDIDLQPLENCKRLETISLQHNKLQSIDLTPLRACTNLKEIYLGFNRLNSIDLSPLATCTNLHKISLRNNRLQTINLTNLSKCPYLEELDIELNNLIDVDFTPLNACHNLSSIKLTNGNSVDIRFSANTWAQVRAIIIGSPNWHKTQYVVFRNLNLLRFGMIDSLILNEISKIPRDTLFEQAQKEIKRILIQKMCDQIDAGGTTIGLEIDEIVKEGKYADLIVRAQKVDELRKEEMNHIAVVRDNDASEYALTRMYDLSDLWLTAYGNIMLRALNMPLYIDEKELVTIVAACKKLGYELRIDQFEDQYHTDMSSELRDFILNLVDPDSNRKKVLGRIW